MYPWLNPQRNQETNKRNYRKEIPQEKIPEKGLITAALRPHKRETSWPRARNREKTYKIYSTKSSTINAFPLINKGRKLDKSVP